MLFKRKTIAKALSMLIILSIAICSALVKLNPTFAAGSGSLITDVNTDKAKYSPGDTVSIYVNLTNNTGSSITDGIINLNFKHLEKDADSPISKTYTLNSGASTTLTFTWKAPSTDYQGYLIEVYGKNAAGTTLDSSSVAVDVSSNWLKFPRYGYLTQYGNSVDTSNIIWQLKNYHINALQYYDWQWKHHVPVKGDPSNPDSSWKDLANRDVYKTTIQNYITAGHNDNIAAMEYNLIYGATGGYGEDGSGVSADWGLFDKPGGQQWQMAMPSGWSTSALYFFNPLNPNWQNYIMNRELDVFKGFNFDGWHADTVGDWGTKYDKNGNAVSITTTFKTFLNYAKSRLGNKLLMMNPVGNKGHEDVNTSNVDAAYTEIWPWDGFPDYNSLKGVVEQAKSESGGKSLIVPAYMDYDYGKNKGSTDSGYFNTPGILLTDAAVFAAGGSRLELGDDTRMLSSEYFPNRNLMMSDDLKKKERNYYDFLVAYENLLRDGQTNTSNQVSLSGYATSSTGEANKVWAFTKKDSNYEIIQMINLLGESDTSWRDTNADKPAPNKITNVPVKYYYSGTVGSVMLASPDSNNCKSTSLAFSTGNDSGGNYVTFTIPSLEYWDMIYISKSTVSPLPPVDGTILNPGFESGDLSNWTATGSNYGVDGNDVHGGSYKCYFWGASAYTQKIAQTVSGLKNGTYTVSAWVKQNTGTPTTSRMELSGYGGTPVYTNIQHGSSYQQITGKVDVTNNSLNIGFFQDAPGNTNLEIDDITLTQSDVTPTPNPTAISLSNPGFESGNINSWTVTGSNYGVDGNDVHSGSYKCYFWGTSTYTQKISQTKTELVNGSYTVKAWVKQSTGTPTICRMELSDFGGSAVYTNISNSSSYQQIIGTVNVTNNALTIAFYLSAPGNTNLQIDDVELWKN